MNRQQLQTLLDDAGVNKSCYSLNGPAQESESYSLVPDGDAWKVLYKERGHFEQIAGLLSENEACDLLYKLLDEAFGIGSRLGASRGA